MAHTRIVRGRSQKRLNAWVTINLQQVVIAASGNVLLAIGNAALLAARPFTIVRTRFQVMYGSDQLAAAEIPIGVLGMVIVQEKAATLGISAVPTPVTEADADWFVYQPVMSTFDFISGTGVSNTFVQYDVDSKAMRKVDEGQDIALVFEQESAFGAEITV